MSRGSFESLFAAQKAKKEQREREAAERRAEPAAVIPPAEAERSTPSQPDSSPVESTWQPETSRLESVRQSIDPAPASPLTRQPKSTRQPESTRQVKSARQADPSRQVKSNGLRMIDGLEHASHYNSFANSVTDRLLPTLPPAAQLAYLQLYRLSYGNRRNWCRIGNPRLAERCGLGESTLKRALVVLEHRGLVEKAEYQFGGDERGTTYVLPIPPDTPEGAIREADSTRQIKSSRQPDSTRQPESGPMKGSKEHGEKGPVAIAPAVDVFGIRTIAARLFEAHRGEMGFDHERLRQLVRDTLIGQGTAPDLNLIDEAIRGMAG